MPRRREVSIYEITFETLKVVPVWVGPVLAIVTFFVLRFVVPQFLPEKQSGLNTGRMLRPLIVSLSLWLPIAVFVLWVFIELWKLSNRRRLDSQTGLESIKNNSWREFELLVSEAYRRKGYTAEVVGSESGDGGVDIRLAGHGETVLVQCKQWKAYKVGVATVRELLGVVVSEKADRGIVVTSGRFTQEAQTFARQNPRIELVNGEQLAQLIRGVQVGTGAAPTPAPIPLPDASPATPACPQCGNTMILRTARKGQHAGSQFWGCPQYPACRGTRQLETGNLYL